MAWSNKRGNRPAPRQRPGDWFSSTICFPRDQFSLPIELTLQLQSFRETDSSKRFYIPSSALFLMSELTSDACSSPCLYLRHPTVQPKLKAHPLSASVPSSSPGKIDQLLRESFEATRPTSTDPMHWVPHGNQWRGGEADHRICRRLSAPGWFERCDVEERTGIR